MTTENKTALVYQALANLAQAQEQSLQQQRHSVSDLISDLSLIQIHVLQCVAAQTAATDARLATQLKLPEAAIIQAIMRLWDEGFVSVRPASAEEGAHHYQISEKGRLLMAQYDDLHRRARRQYHSFLSQYDEASLDSVQKFVMDLTEFLNKTEI